ncbi:2-hydroxyacid dehydrogenase [Pseudosulfitobacter pseudonitzschiae]|uniref:2-hydroxyacid dehydrogenase n=1 Tax=Pseudosulfitobacter pseudonitzschiae TaxID=1402135 RepID=UPI001AFC1B6D|nr:2-hydroxyacid dehydrogenase [Pseudosulfitobacter pseudonitzschiae]MBM1817724.1 2-hydroxyacid dehydrogenase [Pseudosulfitobacter pseudonitzschiae]MBM1834719.1 2-hydroxyacid dehydrogenase [Pseudosulfitobacter pseudonitzschiae]MBM1839583.1 2-hydroxyacid dehydrogenase [Pseudosulfitobacter pseudonitzschiae]MBM1844434.1 2-hydroxyacid dehydrogenase [Pseudosulfitobacter pseudonitzschiae]MBM1849268.1 2-hydroxyacid dehydrogenase [Pseudosulfitobacter pseudonitzschiae]
MTTKSPSGLIGPVAVLDVLTAEVQEQVRGYAAGLDLRFAPSASAQDFAATVRGAPYIVARSLGLSAEVLKQADAVQLVHQWGTGTDGIALDVARMRGIPVARSPGLNAPTVADLTIGLMLATLRRIPQIDATTRAGNWGPAALISGARDLNGMTVGLVGYGAIGQEVARRLSGFGCPVLYHRRSGPIAGSTARHATLDEIFSTCDVVSLHAPLTDSTRHLVGAAQLAQMKPGAFLINTSRGGLVDEAALTTALQSGAIAGAGLDVFAQEPVNPDNPLLALDNVVALPHIGGRTDDNLERMVSHWAANIRAFDAGQGIDPECIVP